MSTKLFRSIKDCQPHGALPVNVLCPGCRQRGTFGGLANIADNRITVPEGERIKQYAAGTRICPNLSCRTLVFVVYDGDTLIASLPVARMDFDAAGVPVDVVRAFEEALTCHANECWMGAGMLIRKAIEQLCADRGATGATLMARIRSLRTKITLPEDLFDAADHLRLLGNDAAHVEAREYNQVGRAEVEAGVELAKELIKAVYQYKGLVDRLQALKKTP